MTGTANAPAGHQTETPPGRRSARRRALIAGATGNIVEWFDFTIYGFTAAVLATVFFPPEFGSGALACHLRSLRSRLLGQTCRRHILRTAW